MKSLMLMSCLLLVTSTAMGFQPSLRVNNFSLFTKIMPSADQDDALIAFRIYRHLLLLQEFNKKNKNIHLVAIKGYECPTCHQGAHYRHELIKLCEKKMSVDACLDPLFETWQLFWNSYHAIEKDVFLYEFSLLIFSLYGHVLTELGHHDQGYVDKIVELHNRVSELPIDELLDVLEKCYVQLVEIMKDYGLFDDQNLIAWLKKNWWLPPVFLASVAYSIFNYYGKKLPPQTPEVDY